MTHLALESTTNYYPAWPYTLAQNIRFVPKQKTKFGVRINHLEMILAFLAA